MGVFLKGKILKGKNPEAILKNGIKTLNGAEGAEDFLFGAEGAEEKNSSGAEGAEGFFLLQTRGITMQKHCRMQQKCQTVKRKCWH